MNAPVVMADTSTKPDSLPGPAARRGQTGQPEWLPTRDTLLSRLRQIDAHESWMEFFELYWQLIFGVCRRFGLDEEASRDVVQETLIAVAQQLPELQRDKRKGAFKTWLFALTRNKVVDYYRKAGRQPNTVSIEALAPEQTGRLSNTADSAADAADEIWEQEWQRNVLERAKARVKARVKPAQFQIFDLYVNRQWSTDEVMKTLQVSRAQVFLAKHRITRLLREEANRITRELDAELE